MRKKLLFILIAAALVVGSLFCAACSLSPTPIAAPTIRLDGDVVGWGEVENATSYDIYINGDKKDSTTQTYYRVVTAAGDYEVKVKAIPSGSEYAESDFSNSVVYSATQCVTKLATPKVTVRAAIAEWAPIGHATSYELYFNGEKLGVTAKTWYVLPDIDGSDYEVKVIAKSSDSAYTDSDYGVYTYHTGDPLGERLATPVLKLTDNVVKWEPVPNAESYDVYIDGMLKAADITETEYTIGTTAYGQYSVSVVAKSTDDYYTDSAASAAVVYEIKRPKLAAPVISLNDKKVSWAAVDNATSYEIFVNNSRIAITSATEYAVSVSVAGTYYVKVKAVGTGYDSSEYSNVEEYNYIPPVVQLAAPHISLAGNSVSWQAVNNATSYKVFINNVLKATVNATSYTITETEIGYYTVKVSAVPSSDAYSESPLSNGVVYSIASPDAQPIDSPSISVTGGVVSWAEVENAASYDVYSDDTLLGNTEELSYSLSSLTAAGDYSITVVARPADVLRYKDSAPSAAKTYTVEKKAAYIEITSYPKKETYFTDEAALGLDLDGLEAVIHYSNYDGTDDVTLTAADASEYDLTVAGRYEIEFTKNGVLSDAIRIYVRVRTAADVSSADLITVVNSLDPDATEYAVTDSMFAATTAYTASGDGFTVTDGKVPASALQEGENLVRLFDGSDHRYALVKVARIITKAEQFSEIGEKLDGYYMLGANIDFSEEKQFMIGSAPLLIDWESKSEQKAAKVYAPRDGVGCEEAPGQLFTGTLDGCGYVLSKYTYTTGDGGYSRRWTTSGVALFGGVGKTGVIRNLVLRDFHVSSTGACALLAGYNAGLIENISIEEDCSISYHWDAAVGISAYNFGVVRNCVSHLATVKLSRNNSDQPMYLTHFGGSSYEVDNGINGFVGAEDDLTDILGDGWYFIPGYGTYYGNQQYKKVISYDSVWYATVPSRIVIFHAKEGLGGLYLHRWGGPNGGGALPFTKISTEKRISVYQCTVGAEFTAGTTFTIGVRYNDNNEYFVKLSVVMGEPYPVSASVADGISVYQGGTIQINDIALTVTMSDGSTKTVTPTNIDQSGFDSTKPIGTVQTVTVFYSDGEREVEASVEVTIVDMPSTPYAMALNITKKSNSLSYGKNSVPDFDSVLDFTVVLSDSNTRTVTLADSALTVGDYTPGKRTVTFTYIDPEVTIQVTSTVELDLVYTIADKEDWKLMNKYLDGYFELKADIDLGGTAEANNPLVIGKLPLDGSNNTDAIGIGDDSTQLGLAFTGWFNGNGYKVKGFVSDYAKNTASAPFDSTSYGLVPFAFVGDGGVVENFTLDGANVKCGQSGSLLVGLNRGTVKNVVIESSCSLIVNYGGPDTGAIANTNCGTLENIVCKVTSFVGHESAEREFTHTVYRTAGGTESNCRIDGEVA